MGPSRITRSNNVGNRDSSSRENLANQVQRLEETMHQNVHELKNLITGNTENSSDGLDYSDIMNKISEFQRSTQSSIDSIKNELHKLNQRLSEQEKKFDDQEQKFLASSLIFSGVPEQEDSDGIRQNIVKIVNTKLKINFTLSESDIKDCYRLGKFIEGRARPRPIFIELVHKWKRDNIFRFKKDFKGSGIVIFENLTRKNLNMYKKATTKYGVKCCWTWMGDIFVNVRGVKRKILTENDI